MNPLQQKIKNNHAEIVAIRRHLHQHPELSFQEVETAKFISEKLSEWGIHHETGVAGTGIVALIEPDTTVEKCIAFRADIDALPIEEQNEVEYRSKNIGVMHACGHDVHTSILLGTAKILNEIRNDLKVKIKLIFQPGEEKLPGGAKLMIEAGVLENPKVEEIYGLHVFPEMEVGHVGLKSGKYMASCDELYFEIIGKGGHAAMPALNIDPIKIAAKLILELQKIPDEICPKDIPCVLAIGRIEGLGATNVIPEKVFLQGTFRTLDENWRKEAHSLIEEITQNIAKESTSQIKVRIEKGYPYVENNPNLTEKTREVLKNELGENFVHDLPVRMTGEDFSFYGQEIPALFMRIGVRNESLGIVHGVHHPKFNIDENALSTGISVFTKIALTQ